jgi:glycogen debranching enzyme
VAALMPLYSGAISAEKAKLLVHQLEDAKLFGTPYPAPSVPVSSPWYKPLVYWQGPTWINTNWMIVDGLRRYGYDDHADAMTESTLELVQKSGCYEYFSAQDGSPAGANNFSWTAALTIDLIQGDASANRSGLKAK